MTIIILLAVAVTVNVSQRALIAQYTIRNAELGSVLQDEQVKNEKLQMQISGMKSPERIEKIAMEKLGMVKPAEISYIRYFNQELSLKKSKTLRLIQNNLPKKESILSTIYNQISDRLNKLFETDFSAQAEIR
jgi:cell division protein FtsL